jgi:hypothetical protein
LVYISVNPIARLLVCKVMNIAMMKS